MRGLIWGARFMHVHFMEWRFLYFYKCGVVLASAGYCLSSTKASIVQEVENELEKRILHSAELRMLSTLIKKQKSPLAMHKPTSEINSMTPPCKSATRSTRPSTRCHLFWWMCFLVTPSHFYEKLKSLLNPVF